MKGEGKPLTCVFSAFAQVLPCFPKNFQLSFPLVRALRAAGGGSGDVHFFLFCHHFSPPLLPPFQTAKRRVLVVSRTQQPKGAGAMIENFTRKHGMDIAGLVVLVTPIVLFFTTTWGN